MIIVGIMERANWRKRMKYTSIRDLIDLCTDQDDIIYELREENAQLRELIRLAIAGFEVVENKHEERFTYWLSEAKKALEKSE